MTKELSEKKKTNPLVYILAVPLGIFILIMAYIQWQKYQDYNGCVNNIFLTETCRIILGR